MDKNEFHWYEPTIEEAKQADDIALRVKEFVLNKFVQ